MLVLPLLAGSLVLGSVRAADPDPAGAPPAVAAPAEGDPLRPAAEGLEPAPAEPAAGADGEAPPTLPEAATQTDSVDENSSLPPSGVDHDLRVLKPRTVLHSQLDELERRTGLRVGVAHTWLFQAATGGDGRKLAGGGDVDLLLRWNAIGEGTPTTGRLSVAGEYRYQIGSLAPGELGEEIGTLLGTADGFGEQPIVLKECYWEQRFDDGLVTLRVGRMNPRNLFGGHCFQNSSTFFLNKALSSNPVVAYPEPGLGATLHVRPTSWLSIGGGVADADGSLTSVHFDGFFNEGRFLEFVEASLIPSWEGLGQGHFRLSLWRKDAERLDSSPQDRGYVVSCDQDLGEYVTVFGRYGYSKGDATEVEHSVTGGVGIRDTIVPGGLTGLGGGWSTPNDHSLKDEKVIEVFQRVPVTELSDLTLGVQVIVDPSHSPTDRVIGVFSVRLRVAF